MLQRVAAKSAVCPGHSTAFTSGGFAEIQACDHAQLRGRRRCLSRRRPRGAGSPTAFSRHASSVCLRLGRPLRTSTFLRSPGQFCRLPFAAASCVARLCLVQIVHLGEEYRRSDAVAIDAADMTSASPLAGPPGFSSVRLLLSVGRTVSNLGKTL